MSKDTYMGLNVKLAWLISLGFIGGLTWLITQVSPPTIAVPIPTGTVRPATEKNEPETRPSRRRFEKPSMLEKEAARTLDRSDRLVVADHPAQRSERPALPPISSLSQRVEADVSVGVASESPGELSAILAARNEMRDTPADPTSSHDVSSEKAKLAIGSDASGPDPTSQAPSAEVRTYKVVKGDNLHRVAKKTLASSDKQAIDALLAANPKVAARRNYTIHLGETIIIPNRDTRADSVRVNEPARFASASEGPNTSVAREGDLSRGGPTPATGAGPSVSASKWGRKSKSSKPTRVATSIHRPQARIKPSIADSMPADGPVANSAATRIAAGSSRARMATRPGRSDKMGIMAGSESNALARTGVRDAPGGKLAAMDQKGRKIAHAGKGVKPTRASGR